MSKHKEQPFANLASLCFSSLFVNVPKSNNSNDKEKLKDDKVNNEAGSKIADSVNSGSSLLEKNAESISDSTNNGSSTYKSSNESSHELDDDDDDDFVECGDDLLPLTNSNNDSGTSQIDTDDDDDDLVQINVNDGPKEVQFVLQSMSSRLQWLEDMRAKAEANPKHISVRVFAAQTRVDVSGSEYTAYLICIKEKQQQSSGKNNYLTVEKLLEKRYSELHNLYSNYVRRHLVNLDVGFPSKNWAGRMGYWTPSIQLAPEKHYKLIQKRLTQLDIWLVHLIELYNNCTTNGRKNNSGDNDMPPVVYDAITSFLSQATLPPCDQVNKADHERWKWNNPFSFTLGASIRQAASTVSYMIDYNNKTYDQSIPIDLLQAAQGLCFMTVFKAGIGVSGRFGTGLVVARQGHNEDGMCRWSAPSALGTVGVGWGPLAGADVTHYLIILTTRQAVYDLLSRKSLQLGAELGVAVGPIGRGATSQVQTNKRLQSLHPAYAYAHSQGLFVGMSLEGSIVTVRHDINAKFYGKSINAQDLVEKQPAPKAADPLYDALNKALNLQIRDGTFRPTVAWKQTTSTLKGFATSSVSPLKSTANNSTKEAPYVDAQDKQSNNASDGANVLTTTITSGDNIEEAVA